MKIHFRSMKANSLRIVKENIKYRKWLSPPDPFLNYREALRCRQSETGIWFLNNDRYKLWKNSGSCLWLHGIPGCGKTVLASTIIENLRHDCDNDPNKLLAFFYFSFNDAQKQKPDLMLRSIICQLSQHIHKPKYLVDLYLTCQSTQRQPSEDELMEILHEIMHDESTGNITTFYIVLDALDECAQPSKLEEIITTLSCFSKLHFLLTSRKERYLEDLMDDLTEDQNIIRLGRDELDDDIQKFVHHQLLHDKYLKKWGRDPAVKQEIEIALKVGPKGM